MAKNFFQQYVTALLEKAGLLEEDGGVDNDYAEQLATELEKKMGLMIMDQLSSEDLGKYSDLVHKKVAPDKLGIFLEEHINEFKEKRSKLLDDFAFQFLQRTAKMRKSLND